MNPLECLIAVGAAVPGEPPYAALVDVPEHFSASYKLRADASTDSVRELAAVFEEPSIKALVTASLIVRRDGSVWLTISTSSRVGFASAERAGAKLFVRVRPKVPTERLLELAAIAERLPPWNEEVTIGTDDVSVLIAWMLHSFASSLEKLARVGGFRPTHERVSDTLQGRVRGKLVLPRFAANLARGRPDRLPCEYSALRLDNEANRILRWALHVASALTKELPELAHMELRWRRLERHLEGVSLVRPSTAIVERGPLLPPNLRHYADCMQLARMLLKGAYLDARAGAAAAACVALDMNDLYETCFWKLIKFCEGSAVRKPTWHLKFNTAESGALVKRLSMEPDIFVPETEVSRAVIIDTKWKHSISHVGADDFRFPGVERVLVRPRTSDIYQASTYALDFLRRGSLHDSCLTVLAYPCLSDVPDYAHRIQVGGTTIEIRIIGWNVSKPLCTSIQETWGRLDSERARLAE